MPYKVERADLSTLRAAWGHAAPPCSDFLSRTFPAVNTSPALPVSAIVLAAGLSRRMAPHNKLLLPWGASAATTVVAATVEAVCRAAVFTEVLVVTGHDRERVERALAGSAARPVFAADFARGMGASLACGVRAARANATGFAVIPGDLPGLNPVLVREVFAAFVSHGGTRHVVPAAGGRRGHPVIVGAWLRSELEQLDGDVGARLLLERETERERCLFLEVGDESILRDVDFTPRNPG
jgi:molybdenum cofactor cytidylyltransferase